MKQHTIKVFSTTAIDWMSLIGMHGAKPPRDPDEEDEDDEDEEDQNDDAEEPAVVREPDED